MLASLLLTLLASLTACSSDGPYTAADYDTVIDVPVLSWMPTDTLLYPIVISSEATRYNPLRQGATYRLRCSVRMTAGFELTQVPMQFIVQQTDTAEGGHLRVLRNVCRHDIAPHVRDKRGQPLGSTWGSLICHEEVLPDVSLRFDSVGTYRMMLIPETSGLASFRGISAIGLSLVY